MTDVQGAKDPATPSDTAIVTKVSLAVAAQASSENFPVALKVLPKVWRTHLKALYGFARLVDDIGDEPLPGLDQKTTDAKVYVQTRLRLLDELQTDIGRIYDGTTPEIAAIRELGVTARACGIPREPFDDLIQANRQDQVVTRYQTFDELVDYCVLSANTVGQAVLYIFGKATPDRLKLSDDICTALQLVEHWQDVAEDMANGRIYLPLEDLDRFGVTEADLSAPSASDALKRLMTFETERATRMLNDGAPLVGTLNGAARLAIAGFTAGGRAALKSIRDCGYDVMQQTPHPRKSDTLTGLLSLYVRGR
jgi:squalene synthase HpnC